MNAAEVAAVVRRLAQPASKSNGERKTPPPIPVSPESSPRVAPATSATRTGGFPRAVSTARKVMRKRTAESSNTTPTTTRYQFPGRARRPPRYAAGIEPRANGQKSDQRKWPARANCAVPIPATSRFSTNAVGRISAGAVPRNAITAR